MDINSTDTKHIEYGKIRYENNELNAKWINDQIKSYHLFCHFNKPNKKFNNGIEVKKEKSLDPLNQELLNILFRTQIQKNNEIMDEETGDYVLAPEYINLMMEYCDSCNKECLDSINILLNHPVFKGSSNIKNINKCVKQIKTF